jgi:hypothetical protein
MTELEQRVLRHRGTPAATVAIAEGCMLGDVQHIRRRHGRSPVDGLEPLERPVDELRADDWAAAMRSNASPFL